MAQPENQGLRRFLFSRSGLVLTGFLVVAGYFLWAEHEAHLIAALPWVLVGGCLLMHLFMHGGHGGHGHDGDERDDGGVNGGPESDEGRTP
jgi:hypothetical protein